MLVLPGSVLLGVLPAPPPAHPAVDGVAVARPTSELLGFRGWRLSPLRSRRACAEVQWLERRVRPNIISYDENIHHVSIKLHCKTSTRMAFNIFAIHTELERKRKLQLLVHTTYDSTCWACRSSKQC